MTIFIWRLKKDNNPSKRVVHTSRPPSGLQRIEKFLNLMQALVGPLTVMYTSVAEWTPHLTQKHTNAHLYDILVIFNRIYLTGQFT